MGETIGLYTPVREIEDFKTLRLDATPELAYHGLAAVGSSESDPVWQIKRLTDDGQLTKIEWADGNAEFDNVWANRASLQYS